MKKTRRFVLGLSACLLSASLFISGCSGGESGQAAKDPVSISIWHYYNGVQKQSFDDLVAEFNDTVGGEKGLSLIHIFAGAAQRMRPPPTTISPS